MNDTQDATALHDSDRATQVRRLADRVADTQCQYGLRALACWYRAKALEHVGSETAGERGV